VKIEYISSEDDKPVGRK